MKVSIIIHTFVWVIREIVYNFKGILSNDRYKLVKYSGAMYNDSRCNMVCISDRYDTQGLVIETEAFKVYS